MGIYPESFIRPFRADAARIVQRLDRVAPAGDSQLTAGKPRAAAEHGAEAPH
jgi:NADH-quinone oxidoreductase subunit M